MINTQKLNKSGFDKQENITEIIQKIENQRNKTILPSESLKFSETSLTEAEREIQNNPVFLEKINTNTPIQESTNSTSLAEEYLQQQYRAKYLAIEGVLEENLISMYTKMSSQQQQRFKSKGEEVTKKIFKMIYQETKINVNKIIRWIKEWLKLIPGINKYFLEQEAKIKADKIIEIAINEGKKD